MSSPLIVKPDRFAQLLKPVMIAFFVLYLLSCLSPLRLETDSVRYFAIRDCLDTGCATNSPATIDFLPYGYPTLLLVLSKPGLLNSFSIAFVNGIFLLFSLWITRKIFRAVNPLLFYAVVLLNWTCIKLMAYALSEMQYLFFSTLSLYCFTKFTNNKRWEFLLISLLSAALAAFTRTVGFTLIAALVMALVWDQRKIFPGKTNRTWVIASFAVATIAFLFSTLPGLRHYITALAKGSPNDPGAITLIGTHIREWGQLLMNIPIGKMEGLIPAIGIDIVFLLAGGLLLAWFIYALFRIKRSIPSVIIIYLVIYSLTIFKWPHFDPRFWIPLLPLVTACLLQAPLPALPRVKAIFTSAFFVYVLMGIIAFGYSFYTQFNKSAFARNQANGKFRHEYEMHFFGKVFSDTSAPVNANVLELLKKYD